MKSVSLKSSGKKLVEYAYDALGRRISKFVYNKDSTETPQPIVSKTFYIWSGYQVVEERDADNNLLAEYVLGPGIDNLLAAKRDTNSDGVAEWHYAVKNHIDSIVAWVDASGNVEERFKYDIFGKPYKVDVETGEVLAVAEPVEAPSAISPYLFTCREYEPETAHAGEPGSGLYYYRARFYSPTQGRFISLDPLNYVDGMNIYAYVNNNPVTFLDPMGLETETTPGGYGDLRDNINGVEHYSLDPESMEETREDIAYLAGMLSNLPPEVIAGIKDGRGNKAIADFFKGVVNALVGAKPININPLLIEMGLKVDLKVEEFYGCPFRINPCDPNERAAAFVGEITVTIEFIIYGAWKGGSGAQSGTGNGNIKAIGRKYDTDTLRGVKGYEVLDVPKWNWSINQKWLDEGIFNKQNFRLLSNLEGNMIQTQGKYAGQATIYAREMAYLISKGYVRIGDFLVHPDNVASFILPR